MLIWEILAIDCYGVNAMTNDEFISAMQGVPWRLHASSLDAADCWGVVVLYYLLVHGIGLADTHSMSMEDGITAQLKTGCWEEVYAPADGVTFMSYRDGHPTHCGVIIGDKVLHSGGCQQHLGYCRLDRLEAMRRLYPDMRFFRLKEIKESSK